MFLIKLFNVKTTYKLIYLQFYNDFIFNIYINYLTYQFLYFINW